MTRSMRNVKDIIQKVLLVNGEMLLGICFVLIGVLVMRAGLSRLLEYWRDFIHAGPIALPKHTAQWIVSALPLIFQIFVNVVSSACGILIGGLWMITGFVDVFESRHTIQKPANFHSADMVAESLRSSVMLSWRSPPWLARVTSWIWPKARFMSPASYEVFEGIFWSFWKLLLLGFVIAVLARLTELVPAILQSSMESKLSLHVPSPKPLYILLTVVAVVNAAIAASLVPFHSRPSERSRTSISFHGRGEPHIFFALLEEACRLLSPKGETHRGAVRVELAENAQFKGSLIENAPSPVPSIGRPAAYLCLPLIVILMVVGFTRMIYFQVEFQKIPYQEFVSRYLLEYLMQLAVALGLILCGLHFSRWARALFAIRTFRSYVLFAFMAPKSLKGGSEILHAARILAYRPGEMQWHPIEGVDEQLAYWARAPNASNQYSLEAFWAEVISEAASSGGLRYPIKGTISQQLDKAVERILELPFYVTFEKDDIEDIEYEPEELNVLNPSAPIQHSDDSENGGSE
jgi:hypothetical protein